MRTSSLLPGAAIAAAASFLFFAAPGSRFVAVAATPPPTPPPIGNPATPRPLASLLPTPDVTAPAAPPAKTAPTPTPPPNPRKGLEGVWEVQIQHLNGTVYTHFALKQDGDALTGTYVDVHGKRYPMVGTVDGQAVRLIVTMPDGTTLLAEGKLDGATDMIGMLTMPDGQVPFTASYRAKEKWIDNVNPSPGGMSQPGGYTPP